LSYLLWANYYYRLYFSFSRMREFSIPDQGVGEVTLPPPAVGYALLFGAGLAGHGFLLHL